jgi:hypothetical protein
MVRYGFEILGLHRLHSNHFGSSPASGRVMQKIGMIREGTRRDHYKKWGEYEDRVEYGLLAGEWRAAQGHGGQEAWAVNSELHQRPVACERGAEGDGVAPQKCLLGATAPNSTGRSYAKFATGSRGTFL